MAPSPSSPPSDPGVLERTFGEIRGRIMGKFAKGPVPPGTPAKMNLTAALAVMPFMLKGKLGRKGKRSPFFAPDGTPIVKSRVLTKEERTQLRKQWETYVPGRR